MSTYRAGTHHGVTIVREGDGSRCGRPEHDCDRGHLAAVVVDGGEELAERICALLNGDTPHGLPALDNLLDNLTEDDFEQFRTAVQQALRDTPPTEAGDPARAVECKLVRYAGPGPTDPCGCFAWEHCAMAASDSCTCRTCPRHGVVL